MMRIGIYGGTFDPVHIGHLLLAEQCREQCRLDEVWFVPAGAPPHKSDAEITAPQRRLEMLELAIAGHDGFRIQTLELHRPGPSFTVDTLQHFHDEQPVQELFLMLGADSVRELSTWREPQRIFQLANVVAVNRGDRPAFEPELAARQFGPENAARIICVAMPGIDIASRDIRQRVNAGRSIRYLVPRAVEVYIGQHRLYAPTPAAP